MLSIIIPHFKETFEFMRPLFNSLDGQRLIDFSQVEVIIVNDCGDPLKMEQFEVFEHIRPHLLKTKRNAGAGVARQRGIDWAHGEFLMFIDSDDCLHGQHALFRVMSAIYGKPETDLFHGQFIEEQLYEEMWGLHLHNRDITFHHGKIYRKAFLTEKNVRCHPTLRYNEDSYFNGLVYAEAEKIEYIDEPLSIWTSNPDSTVRAGGLYAYTKLPDYIQGVSDLCAELVARKKPQAKMTFLQSLFYIYFQLQDEAWELRRVKEMRPAAIEATRKYFKRHEKLYECGSEERKNFYNECRKQASSPIMERQTFEDFLEEVKYNAKRRE